MWLIIKFGKMDTDVIDTESCNGEVLALQSACAKLRAGYRVYENRWSSGAIYMTEEQVATNCGTQPPQSK